MHEHLFLRGGSPRTELAVTLGVLAAHGPCPRGAYEGGMTFEQFFGSVDDPGEVARAHGGVLTVPATIPRPWLALLGGLMADGELTVRSGGRTRTWPTRFRLVMSVPSGIDVPDLIRTWWPEGQRFGILDLDDFELLLDEITA